MADGHDSGSSTFRLMLCGRLGHAARFAVTSLHHPTAGRVVANLVDRQALQIQLTRRARQSPGLLPRASTTGVTVTIGG